MVKITSIERADDAEDPNLHVNECNICSTTIDEQAGDINGYFGILPVSFCVWCLSSMTDMVIQMNGFNDIEMLEERINELREDSK